MSVESLLAEFPSRVEVPVAWGDMDSFGHVNNAMYFRYFESGRIDYFARMGYPHLRTPTDVGPILGYIDCRFRRPVTWPDTLVIGTRVEEVGEDRFVVKAVAVSREQGALVAESTARVVSYDYRTLSKCPLPEAMRSRIAALESGA